MDWDKFFKLTACDHRDLVTVRKKIANGTDVYRKQCKVCGSSIGNSIAKKTLTNTSDIPMFDVALQAEWDKKKEAVKTLLLEEDAQKESAWWNNYNDYLQSEAWSQKREKVIARDRYLCQACLSAQAVEVHHLTYKNMGCEPLFELISVCSSCHAKIHQKESDGAKAAANELF